MELKELKCKNCGANIEVPKDATTVTCKFCNTTFSVDSAENTGYEFEKGRIKAQKEELSNSMSEENKKVVGSVFKGIAISSIVGSVIFAILFIVVLGFIIFTGFKIFKSANESNNKFSVTQFNLYFTNDSGTQDVIFVKDTLDDVITSNKTKDRKITVIYNDIKTKDPDEIKDLKKSLTDEEYEVSFNYDDDGYICEAIIEDIDN